MVIQILVTSRYRSYVTVSRLFLHLPTFKIDPMPDHSFFMLSLFEEKYKLKYLDLLSFISLSSWRLGFYSLLLNDF